MCNSLTMYRIVYLASNHTLIIRTSDIPVRGYPSHSVDGVGSSLQIMSNTLIIRLTTH